MAATDCAAAWRELVGRTYDKGLKGIVKILLRNAFGRFAFLSGSDGVENNDITLKPSTFSKVLLRHHRIFVQQSWRLNSPGKIHLAAVETDNSSSLSLHYKLPRTWSLAIPYAQVPTTR
jgi:hypothetical protein